MPEACWSPESARWRPQNYAMSPRRRGASDRVASVQRVVLQLRLADPLADADVLARVVARVNRVHAADVTLERLGSVATLTAVTWGPMLRARVDAALEDELGAAPPAGRFRWL